MPTVNPYQTYKEGTVGDGIVQPYELGGEINAEMVAQMNEMFKDIYNRLDKGTAITLAGQRLLGRFANSRGPSQSIRIGDNLTLDQNGILSADEQSGSFAPGDVGVVHIVTRSLSIAEWQSLGAPAGAGQFGTTPIELVAAPGADKIIVPLQWSAEINTTIAGPLPSTEIALHYDHADFGGFTLLPSILSDDNNVRTKITWNLADLSGGYTGYSSRDPRNKAVAINVYDQGDASASTCTAVITFIYYVINSTLP